MRELYSELMDRFEELKREIRERDRLVFERWKAGGYLLDDSIISGYPNLGEIVEQLGAEEEDDDDPSKNCYEEDDE